VTVGRTSEEGLDGRPPDVPLPGGAQVGDCGLPGGPGQYNRTWGAGPPLGGQPQRQLAAGGVPGDGDGGKVQVGGLRNTGEGVEARQDDVERAGPAAAWFADAPELQVPNRYARPGQVPGNTGHQAEPPGPVPEPSVQKNHHRVGRRGHRKPQVSELRRLATVPVSGR
jgi:hypothetical protein